MTIQYCVVLYPTQCRKIHDPRIKSEDKSDLTFHLFSWPTIGMYVFCSYPSRLWGWEILTHRRRIHPCMLEHLMKYQVTAVLSLGICRSTDLETRPEAGPGHQREMELVLLIGRSWHLGRCLSISWCSFIQGWQVDMSSCHKLVFRRTRWPEVQPSCMGALVNSTVKLPGLASVLVEAGWAVE